VLSYPKRISLHVANSLRASARWALLALPLAGCLAAVALAGPSAASAATPPLGPGGLSPWNQVSYPKGGGVYTSGALAGCALVVGDHYRTDGYAAGQANIWCSGSHYVMMTVYLDYRTTANGPLYTATSIGHSGTIAGGSWSWLYTGGLCHPGGQVTYLWTTEVRVSVDGSPWVEWFVSQANVPYTEPAC
jgi:hypothetical protein